MRYQAEAPKLTAEALEQAGEELALRDSAVGGRYSCRLNVAAAAKKCGRAAGGGTPSMEE